MGKFWTQGGFEVGHQELRLLREKNRQMTDLSLNHGTGGDTEHNSDQTAGFRGDFTLLDVQATRLAQLLNTVQPAPIPDQMTTARMNHLLTCKFTNGDGKEETLSFVLGGESEPESTFVHPQTRTPVSTFNCYSPVWGQFLGKGKGEEITITFGKRMVDMEIISIQLPILNPDKVPQEHKEAAVAA